MDGSITREQFWVLANYCQTFFEKRGYEVQVERQGIFLTNYVMVKQKRQNGRWSYEV
ncbi:MAG: hypothetical protein ACLTVV_10945 [Ruminococcus sp.]